MAEGFDWQGEVAGEREFLQRLVVALSVFAGLSLKRPGGGTIGNPPKPTIARHARFALLRMLRPAEAATRRLVMVLARLAGPVPAPPPRAPRPLLDPREAARREHERRRNALLAKRRPPPRNAPPPPPPPFRVTEAEQPLGTGYAVVRARRATPRIGWLGDPEPAPRPVDPRRLPDFPVRADGAFRRLESLRAALADLPRCVERLRRWEARRLRDGSPRRALRRVRPPGTSRRRRREAAQASLSRACALVALLPEPLDSS